MLTLHGANTGLNPNQKPPLLENLKEACGPSHSLWTPAPGPLRLGSPAEYGQHSLHLEGGPSEAEWEMVRKSAVGKFDAILGKQNESIFSRK